MLSISAEEFDRRFDAGEDLLKYCTIISEAEMEKHVRLSREGKLEAYLAKWWNTVEPASSRRPLRGTKKLNRPRPVARAGA